MSEIFQESPLLRKIRKRELYLVPKEELIPEILLNTKDEEGHNLYSVAVQYDQSHEIPAQAYTKEALASKTPGGVVLMCQILFESETLPITLEQITQETLNAVCTHSLQNAFHFAAIYNRIHNIPTKFLTPENLETQDQDGKSPFSYMVNFLNRNLDYMVNSPNRNNKYGLRKIPTKTLIYFLKKKELSKEIIDEETQKRIRKFQVSRKVTKAQSLIHNPK